MKAKIFFDTQVVSDLAGDAQLREGVWRKISNQYRYLISPLTMFELFFGLAGAGDEYFHVHQTRFQTLRGTGKPTILPLPERFAIKYAVGFDVGQEFHKPSDCEQYIRLVLKAKSKLAIKTGTVALSSLQPKRRSGMLLDDVRDARLEIIKDHVDLLQRVRTGEQPVPTELDWAKSILSTSGAPVTDDGAQKFLRAANAVYHYDKWLWDQAPGTYRFDGQRASRRPHRLRATVLSCGPSNLLSDGRQTYCSAD